MTVRDGEGKMLPLPGFDPALEEIGRGLKRPRIDTDKDSRLLQCCIFLLVQHTFPIDLVLQYYFLCEDSHSRVRIKNGVEILMSAELG